MKKKNAIIVVDVLVDFCPGGALPVDEGDQVVPVINSIMQKFDVIALIQEWHPADHGSFASVHGKKVFSMGELDGKPQVMWPDHGVEYTDGSMFHHDLMVVRCRIFRKGMNKNVDSYSGFSDNNGKNPSGLAKYLKEEGVTDVYVCGLATDYCVKATALDAVKKGFTVHVIEEACRGVEMKEGDTQKALDEMEAVGVHMVKSVLNTNQGSVLFVTD